LPRAALIRGKFREPRRRHGTEGGKLRLYR